MEFVNPTALVLFWSLALLLVGLAKAVRDARSSSARGFFLPMRTRDLLILVHGRTMV